MYWALKHAYCGRVMPLLPLPGVRDIKSSAVTLIQNLYASNPLPSPVFLAVIMFLILIPRAVRAQTPVAPAQQPLRVATEIVKINLSVMGNSGDFIAGLEQKNFRVLDSGTEQPIVFFASTDAPAQIMVMVETSPAVYLIQNEHLTAAFALVQGLAADDQVALVTYSQEPHAVLAFTADKTALTNALGQIQYTLGMGQLNFFDSISTVLDWIAPLPGKKALVLLTTGSRFFASGSLGRSGPKASRAGCGDFSRRAWRLAPPPPSIKKRNPLARPRKRKRL